MGITIDRYVAEYEGHTIELVRNAWVKTLTLRIDDTPVASASVMVPRNIILTGALEHHGVQHAITAKSLVHHLLSTKESIEVDGVVLAGTKTQ